MISSIHTQNNQVNSNVASGTTSAAAGGGSNIFSLSGSPHDGSDSFSFSGGDTHTRNVVSLVAIPPDNELEEGFRPEGAERSDRPKDNNTIPHTNTLIYGSKNTQKKVRKDTTLGPEIRKQGPEIRTLLFVALTELPLNENLVYSFLIKRMVQNKGNIEKAAVSNTQIAAGTTLNRDRTIPAVLNRWAERGLTKTTGQKTYLAGLAPGAKLRGDEKSKHLKWYQRLQYYDAVLSPNLTLRESLLYWRIDHRPGQKQSYYQKCLGVGKQTICDHFKKLRELGLVVGTKPAKGSEGFFALSPQPIEQETATDDAPATSHRAAVRNNPSPQAVKTLSHRGIFKLITEPQIFESVEKLTETVDGLETILKTVGITTKEMDQLFEDFGQKLSQEQFEALILGYYELLIEAARITQDKRETGNFDGPNCLGILRKFTDNAVVQLRAMKMPVMWSWSLAV